MKSKTSFFNPGVSRNLLRRCWPLWACYLAALLLILPFVLMSMVNGRILPDPQLPGQLNSTVLSGIEVQVILSFGMGALTAMTMYSYLYSSKGCGLMNTLPITRTTMFWTAWFTGLLPMLGAQVLTALCCLPFVLSYGLELRFLLMWLGAAAMTSVCFFGFAAFCATLTGSIIILPLVYAVLSFTAVVAEVCAIEVLRRFIYGMAGSPGRLTFLSPPVCLLKHFGFSQSGDYGELIQVRGYGCFAVYCAVGAVFAVLGWLLYRKRRMETAGDTVSVPVLKPVFKYCMAFGTALVFTTVIYGGILNLDACGGKAAALILLMLLIGAFLGYFAAQMLIQKTVKVFRDGWKGMLITWAVLALLVAAGEFDLTGFERRVPAADQVELVMLDGTTYRQSENVEQIVALHRAAAANKAANERLTDEARRSGRDGQDDDLLYLPMDLVYHLRDGRTVQRSYYVLSEREATEDPDSIPSRLRAVINAQEGLEDRCSTKVPVVPENVGYCQICFARIERDEIDYTEYDLSPAEAVDFFNNAVLPDLAEGHIARRALWWDEERAELVTNAQVNMSLRDQKALDAGGDWMENSSWFTLSICTDAVHCMDWIEQHTGERPVLLREVFGEDARYYDVGSGVG